MYGLKSERAQKKLHTVADLTFAKAIEVAERIEASTQQFNCDSSPTVHLHQLCSYSFLRFIH